MTGQIDSSILNPSLRSRTTEMPSTGSQRTTQMAVGRDPYFLNALQRNDTQAHCNPEQKPGFTEKGLTDRQRESPHRHNESLPANTSPVESHALHGKSFDLEMHEKLNPHATTTVKSQTYPPHTVLPVLFQAIPVTTQTSTECSTRSTTNNPHKNSASIVPLAGIQVDENTSAQRITLINTPVGTDWLIRNYRLSSAAKQALVNGLITSIGNTQGKTQRIFLNGLEVHQVGNVTEINPHTPATASTSEANRSD